MDHVYVAPTFSLPEEESTLTSDGELQPMTSNATTMIGADQLNATGFTGKGMKVAGWMRWLFMIVLPIMILAIFFIGLMG